MEERVTAATEPAPVGSAGRRSAEDTIASRRAYAALGAGLVLVAAFGWQAESAAVGSILYLTTAGFGTLLSVIGARRMPRARRRIWWAFAAAQATFLTGDVLWELFDHVLHIDPFPSVADVAYLATYPILAFGMLCLVRGRRQGRDRAAFLDAAIITAGVAIIGIVFVVTPAANAAGTTLLEQAVGAAYPLGDLLVLALALRLLTAGLVRNAALWAVLGCLVALLGADLSYLLQVSDDATYPVWIDHSFLVSYLLLGFAAIHPSAHTLSEPLPERPDRITIVRVVWLGVALLVAPVTDELAEMSGFTGSDWVVLLGGTLVAYFVVLRLWDLVTELQRKAVQLAALARRDGLTGVANRRTWDHELSRACAYARSEASPLTVVVLDMDNFKLFNDTYGHMTGDLALKETTAAWSSIVEGRGFLARFGGEEFTALLPMDRDDAAVVVERMRRAVSHGQTCSAGLAQWDGAESPGELVARADQALYRAKHAGRNRVAIHDGSATQVVTSTSGPDAVLDSLVVVYQPIVDLRTREVVGAEGLSRFGDLDPRGVFDDAARDGTEVLFETVAIRRAIAGWHGRGRLAVNVSLSVMISRELQDVLPDDLTGLTFEITETDLVAYSPEMMLAIDGFRERGAQIAVDDFGTGFSNVHRLAMIHPEVVKLDMTLIRGIDSNEMLQAVVSACVHFARATDSELVAEGIETEAEWRCLARLGVPFGQGYFLGRPGPMAAIAATAAAHGARESADQLR